MDRRRVASTLAAYGEALTQIRQPRIRSMLLDQPFDPQPTMTTALVAFQF